MKSRRSKLRRRYGHAVTGLRVTNADEQHLASAGRCIWQVSYGTPGRPHGKQYVSPHGWSVYCGKKAGRGHLCKEHVADLRSGNV